MATKGMAVFRSNGEDYTINDPNIADEFDSSAAYTAGTPIYYQGNLYVFTSDHPAGAWNSAHVQQVKLGQQVRSLENTFNSRKINGHVLSSDFSITKSDVGLGNVENTSDANKPVSIAQNEINIRKANQPLDGNGMPIDGTNGQVLRTNGDGTTQWASVGQPTDEQTAEAVSAWLDEHPEATTTVQDHSLSYNKFMDGTLGYVMPQMFGAVGDGETDDTSAFAEALQYSCVLVPKGTYKITEPLTSYSDMIVCEVGAIIDYDGNTDIVLSCVSKAVYIEGLTIDGNDKAIKGISVLETSDSTEEVIIKGCTCMNFDNNEVSASPAGIVVARKTKRALIDGCTIKDVNRTIGNSGSIASIGISVQQIDGTCDITNNIISGIYFDETVKTDADGIQVFGYNNLDGNLHDIAVNIANNVLKQCQGRFFKVVCDNVIVDKNTATIDDLELITNFRGIDLQIGKGTISNNRITIENNSSTPSGAFCSCSARSYTNKYAQFSILDNEFINKTWGGYGILYSAYNIFTSCMVRGNNIMNVNFGVDIANSGVTLTNYISVIVTDNTFSGVSTPYRSREASTYIKPIIEHNYGYTYANDEKAQLTEAIGSVEQSLTTEIQKVDTKITKSLDIPSTVTTVRNLLLTIMGQFIEAGVGNYMFKVLWRSHGTYCGNAYVFSATTGMLWIMTGAYMYTLNYNSEGNSYSYTFTKSGDIT